MFSMESEQSPPAQHNDKLNLMPACSPQHVCDQVVDTEKSLELLVVSYPCYHKDARTGILASQQGIAMNS